MNRINKTKLFKQKETYYRKTFWLLSLTLWVLLVYVVQFDSVSFSCSVWPLCMGFFLVVVVDKMPPLYVGLCCCVPLDYLKLILDISSFLQKRIQQVFSHKLWDEYDLQ